jgi:hypothetical protein
MKNKSVTQDANLSDSSKQEANQKFSIWRFSKSHPTLSVLLLGIMAAVIVFVWKNIENDRQKSMIIKIATQQIETNQHDLLKIMAKPLVWNIRSEMLRGNLEQVNILISDLVKEKNFRYIHIIAPDGNVILSTNKSMEGKPIGNEIDPNLLVIESPAMVIFADKMLVVAAPIMGVDRRLATLVVGYTTMRIKIK